ncbi:MAG: 3-phosphoglycerate dehydrogenase, partial [Anaerolineales bacterium]|nr:3-phosphoglycerate dehydrogenase [Anaerolineales bacterium]
MRLLVCDPIEAQAVAAMREAGIAVDVQDDITTEQLQAIIDGYDALVVHSRTKVPRALIERADRLKLIIRAGVGLDNVDAETARERAIEVQNTPEASSNAVAELTIAYLFGLARSLCQAAASLRAGV